MRNSAFAARVVLAVGLLATLGNVGVPVRAEGGQSAAQPAKNVKPADLTGTWAVDKAHTDISFSVMHLGVSKTRGRFTDFDGTLTVDGVRPEKSSVVFTIKVDSIDTGNKDRDNHLRGKEFFDVATYPEITFKSTRVQKKGREYAVTGDLSLHGVTRPVTLTFVPSNPQVSFDKKLHAGLETRTRINRMDYGLKWNALIEGTQVVGADIDIDINFEAIKQ
ncbi:MAG: YceI family protein [Capsulimonadales bacterium]|nr:YceI family protein [Capsulimonadales bacterium]